MSIWIWPALGSHGCIKSGFQVPSHCSMTLEAIPLQEHKSQVGLVEISLFYYRLGLR
jgi:hypothetical protein